jgi:predicted amidohydrolase
MTLRVGLVQLCAGDDPVQNLPATQSLIADAAGQGAHLIATPEVTNIISTSRMHQQQVLAFESEDKTLKALQHQAQSLKIWLLIGSLALKTDDPDGRFANRSFLINPNGQIAARYNKIHMFDVQVSETETYRESAGYRPGDTTALAQTPFGAIGLTICYDMRFPHLYRHLAQSGANILTAPSAFSPITGAAHWHALLRARAIETASFIIAPAQTGDHAISQGKPRTTYGHSLVVDPWGTVLLDAGTQIGAYVIDINLDDVQTARNKVPALTHDRAYKKPTL